MMQNINEYSIIVKINFDDIFKDYLYHKEGMYDEAQENDEPLPSVTEICKACVYTWLQEALDYRRPVELPFWDQVCKDFEAWIIERGLE